MAAPNCNFLWASHTAVMVVTSVGSYLINNLLAAVLWKSKPKFNFEHPLTSLVWLNSLTSIAVTFIVTFGLLSHLADGLWWKLAVIIWHLLKRGEDYAWVRPALHAEKLRDLELRSGQPARRGQRGPAYDYNLARTRREERRRVERAELAYRRQTEGWTRRGPKAPTGAASEERR